MEKLEGFRSEFDGAQDYDIILRMSENAQHILHIPKILYHWEYMNYQQQKQEHMQKPYAYGSRKKAVQAHIDRLGTKKEL